MKICCLDLPPTLVKTPSARSNLPLWLSCWLKTSVGNLGAV